MTEAENRVTAIGVGLLAGTAAVIIFQNVVRKMSSESVGDLFVLSGWVFFIVGMGLTVFPDAFVNRQKKA